VKTKKVKFRNSDKGKKLKKIIDIWSKDMLKSGLISGDLNNANFVFGIANLKMLSKSSSIKLKNGFLVRSPNRFERASLKYRNHKDVDCLLEYSSQIDDVPAKTLGQPSDEPSFWCDFLGFALVTFEIKKKGVFFPFSTSYRPYATTKIHFCVIRDPVLSACPPFFDYYLWDSVVDHSKRVTQESKETMPLSVVEESEVLAFSEYLDKLIHLCKSSRFQVAIRRYMFSKIPYSSNRLIDGVIALEALLGDDALSTGSITYKLSMRTAALLGASEDEKQTIVQFIKKIYGARSELVHGATHKNIGPNLIWLEKNKPNYLIEVFNIVESLIRLAVEQNIENLSKHADSKLLK